MLCQDANRRLSALPTAAGAHGGPGGIELPEAVAHKIDTAAAAIHAGMTAEQIYDMDLAYAPPFGPSWSPFLIAASQLSKALD